MRVRRMQPGESIDAQRGEIVVCIPVYNGHEQFVACLSSVLRHTPNEIPVLICDDASPDPRPREHVAALEGQEDDPRTLVYMRRERNAGFPANVNGAFAAAAPADVVILNSDCIVAEGWLEGLHDAAYLDSKIATATALTNHGTLVSVPDRGMPRPELPAGWSFEEAAEAVRARSLRLRPALLTAVGHCVYVRRSALELVGDFDLAFSPGYGEEVDFSQRCLHIGLSHVAADDVLVYHYGGASFGPGGVPSPVQERHERVIATRYPYYHAAVTETEQDQGGPLARSLGAARRALSGLRVVVDARILSGPMTGTQVHVLELIAAVARTEQARVTAIVPPKLSAYAWRVLEPMTGVEQLTMANDTRSAATEVADVVHRPYQVASHADLVLASRLGRRLVLTQQDLIAYHNPSYFRSFDAWEGYRRLTRTSLAVADRVLFFSEHARTDALREDLIEPDRASVVKIGIDHTIKLGRPAPSAPALADRLPAGAEMVLCIGTDFRHKNRLFALRMLEQLQLRHDWGGFLVVAGPPVSHGSSGSEEVEALARSPRLAQAVLRSAAVTEAEKEWLYERASLVVYPTVHEGFGLVPFEAADHGVPCMWAQGTSLGEILPEASAEIVPWDPAASAGRALALLREQSAREANLTAIRSAARELTWDRTAERLLEHYHRTCDEPASPAGALERRHGAMQEGLSEDAMRLVGPGGALPSALERPLLALATHPQVGSPVFGAIKLGYRVSYRLRRRRAQTNGRVGSQ